MEKCDELTVWLHDTPVGILRLTTNEGTDFRLLESYKGAYPRPVLGQLFLDDLNQVQHSRSRVPPWFSNLLPEGPLRELVAHQAGVHVSREFHLLHHLGEDLPGAVRITGDSQLLRPPPSDTDLPRDQNGEWHFSLAGVQLKFSARRSERGLTIPVSGQGGDWILKLPDARYPNVPENEYATMRWAEACGIEIPEIALIPLSEIQGLPTDHLYREENIAFAIRRFDRSDTGQRVHMEDFAQILGLYPEEKYQRHNYETLARLILALTGESGLDEFIRRLVFMAISGNGDAHHKNWSLLYPDQVHARLSPAYDLVSTIQYMDQDALALNLARSKRWQDVSLDGFRRLARRIGQDEVRMVEHVTTTVHRILSIWQQHQAELGYQEAGRLRLENHFRALPLVRQCAG